MAAPYTEREAATIRDYVSRRVRARKRSRTRLLSRARSDSAAIVERLARVLSDDSHRLLVELMRFRHFKRYYLELDFDGS